MGGKGANKRKPGNRPAFDHAYTRNTRNAVNVNRGPQGSPKGTCSESSAPTNGDPCIECKHVIGEHDEALMCDCCDQWYCFTCSHIASRSIYEALAQSSKEDGIMWYCRHCRISYPGMKKTVEKVARLEKNQEDIISRLEKLENGGIESAIKDVLEEKQHIEERQLNLICFGLDESNKGSAEERRSDDETRINFVLNEILNANDVVFKERPVRLGKFDKDKKRPVKLFLTNVESKKSLEICKRKSERCRK